MSFHTEFTFTTTLPLGHVTAATGLEALKISTWVMKTAFVLVWFKEPDAGTEFT